MKRYLCFRHNETREIALRVDVTGQSERSIERILLGMLINIWPDCHVADLTDEDLERGEGM